MDITSRFTGRAKDYTVGRPTYAREFVESLYTDFGISKESVIADIGSGTGKFAKQLLEQGNAVICVEPNDDMRNMAIRELQKYEKFQGVKGTATETTLASPSSISIGKGDGLFVLLLFQ